MDMKPALLLSALLLCACSSSPEPESPLDGGPTGRDASRRPDASASEELDAGSPPDAEVVRPDASAALDASADFPDASNRPDASWAPAASSDLPDAWSDLPDASSDLPDASTPDGGDLGPTQAEAYAELRSAILPLNDGWSFQCDGDGKGEDRGWHPEAYDEAGWHRGFVTGKTWEEQGQAIPGVATWDGVAWYRKRFVIPADWEGFEVRLGCSGVDDEYDVYLNGQHLKHFGYRDPGSDRSKDRSVFNWQTYTRLDQTLRYGEENLLAIRVVDWGAGGGLWKEVTLRRRVPLEDYRPLLPEPVIESRPDWVQLYWTAWETGFQKVSFGTAANGFAAAYMDEGFNESIYQWDSCFMCLFGRYGARLFPVMETLDNFYSKQRADGYIQRVYSETNGGEVSVPTTDEPSVNPPLFAWVEWEYYRLSGDESRLGRVFPKLEAYFTWLENNVRKAEGQGLYFQTDLGSGMDNTPRGEEVHGGGWVDMTSQQALAALSLERIAGALGKADRQQFWREKHAALKQLLNDRTWHATDGYYYDLRRTGALDPVKHIGAFWTLVSGVADGTRASELVAHLTNPDEFYRYHLFPTLAANEPAFDPKGHYWHGAVWAPTNYAVAAGLRQVGRRDLARELAENHVTRMIEVLSSPPTDEEGIAPEERDGDYATLWECYSSESAKPGTRWDNTFYSRQDFVGWSGVGPIAMLIEDVLGFDVQGQEGKVVWHLSRLDRHGIRRLGVGSALVSMVAEPRASASAGTQIAVEATEPFTLEIQRTGVAVHTVEVEAGSSVVTIP